MPRLSSPRTQDECLYDSQWTKEVDNLFIDLLLDQHFESDWKCRRPSIPIIEVINNLLETDFIITELEGCVDFLNKRYLVFLWMLGKHDLRHHKGANVLTTPVDVNSILYQSNPFSISYQDLGKYFVPTFSLRKPLGVMQQPKLFLSDVEQDGVDVAESSINTEEGNLCRNSIVQTSGRPRDKDISSECSVNKSSHVVISPVGGRPSLCIPRPPYKCRPPPCKGSCSDPMIKRN
ncbi:ATP-dependent RNA helicase DBP2, partial [Striga asiatica]